MKPGPDEVEALARAIDRIVFADSAALGPLEVPGEITGLISYLSDSFPRIAAIAARRDRLERRVARALRLPRSGVDSGRRRIEAELSRRL
ncbi:MAG TPA: hypothetical protein VLS53_07955, partial [Candidatus Dormibacteraeota bacterium]|nr:hypothetical protein [Candidatus Dormibacteraeota bacterium]